MNKTPTIYIIDDEAVVRDALRLLLTNESFTIETYDSAETFLANCPRERYGCAIVDMRMSGMDGLQLQEELTRRSIRLPIIFLTGHGDIPMSVRAIKGGAVDFLTKPITGERLLQSIHTAFSESRNLLAHTSTSKQATSCLAKLTDREREVMLLAIAGHPNKEIGRQLGISHRTVEIHKARIMHKTGAANLLDLARIAQEGGIALVPSQYP
jgi:FixJ family two-component response regulator